MTLKINANPNDLPIGALITANLISSQSKVTIEIDYPKIWKFRGNIQLFDKNELICETNHDVARYLARTFDDTLYGGQNILERTQIDSWMTLCLGQLIDRKTFANTLEYLNHSLTMKTYLVGGNLTLADIFIYSTLSVNLFDDITIDSHKFPHINRWYKLIQSFSSVKKLPKIEQTKKRQTKSTKNNTPNVRKEEGAFIDLPFAEMGKVVLRFPPEASGYLHIGHAKAALLNQYYTDLFHGKLIMRFDDTNPAKEKVEYEQAILEDLQMLEIKPDRFTHSSDYFDVMLQYCEELIKNGKAFVDDTPALIVKQEREQKLPSKTRDNSVEINLKLWNEMIKGTKIGQENCVRAKIDYESSNGCMRDPVIYRCKPEPHPRTGNKYNVYPTYDFACPIIDSIEGVTHTLRTTEYHDRDDQFYWFIDALKLRRPYIYDFSRLNMTNTVLSKRKLTWFVDEKIVDGWDDPRFPTVRGILRRGMTVTGLKQFIIAQGSSRSVVFMEWDKIWAYNKKVIDPIAVRYTALNADDLIPVIVDGDIGDKTYLTVQNHPKDPAIGTKRVRLSRRLFIERSDAELLTENQNATFVNWGNLMVNKVEKASGVITQVKVTMNLDNKDFKNTLKLTWLAADDTDEKEKISGLTSDLVPCVAVYFNHIISKPLLGKDDDFKDFVAKDTKKEIWMMGEAELKRVKKGEIIQLQRKGFFRCDVPYAPLSDYTSRERPLVLFHIPDGHATAPVSFENSDVATNNKQTVNTSNENITNGVEKSSTNIDLINKEIEDQGNKIRRLKSDKAKKELINEEVTILLKLKDQFKRVSGNDWKPQSNSQSITSLKKMADCSEPASNNIDIINKQIEDQGNKIRKLKAEKVDKVVIDQEVKTLLALKDKYKNVSGNAWKPQTNFESMKTPKETAETLNGKIVDQGNEIRKLKADKSNKKLIDDEVKVLLNLKSQYKTLSGKEWEPSASSNESNTKRKPANESQKKDKQKNNPANKESESVKTGTRLGLEAKKNENLSDWYSQVITKGEMIEYYDVSGCYILRPWSYAVWDVIKDFFDAKIKKMGVQNCYFPIFVSKAALEREKTHIADFAPEVAWVTKSGESDLAEPIAIRPTSETVMYPAYAKWLKSHRDLPLRLNQWNNVVRWEFKHPQPFLRTREFLWQEGHSAFLTQQQAAKEVMDILELYARVYEELLAIPVVRGRKTEKEKFAGGDYTMTVEAYIPASGRAIQGATSHHLGQNFSKMFDIQVETGNNDEKMFVYQNSWGLTTRTIGVMIMVHGDDKGLVLPPKVAAVQVVIIPCGITATTTIDQRNKLMNECLKLEEELSINGVLRVKRDDRDNYSPGWKFNHWELKGVPLRVELGFKDLDKNQVTIVRRDNFNRITIDRSDVFISVNGILETIQQDMFEKANAELKEHIKLCKDWSQFCTELEKKNLLLAPFCGEIGCEDKIKADSTREGGDDEVGAPSMGAKSLCLPHDQPTDVSLESLKCIHPSCKNKPYSFVLFGRSY